MFEGYGESVGNIELGLPLRRCPRICKRVSGLTIKYGYSSRLNIPGILLSCPVAFGSNRGPPDIGEEVNSKASSGSSWVSSEIAEEFNTIFTTSVLLPCGSRDKVSARILAQVESWLLTSSITAVAVGLFLFSTGG